MQLQYCRFTVEELRQYITADEIAQSNVFVVGSASVLLQIEKNLQELGIAADRIHDERLTM